MNKSKAVFDQLEFYSLNVVTEEQMEMINLVQAFDELAHRASTNEGPPGGKSYAKSYAFFIRDSALFIDNEHLLESLKALAESELDSAGIEFDENLYWLGYYDEE